MLSPIVIRHNGIFDTYLPHQFDHQVKFFRIIIEFDKFYIISIFFHHLKIEYEFVETAAQIREKKLGRNPNLILQLVLRSLSTARAFQRAFRSKLFFFLLRH